MSDWRGREGKRRLAVFIPSLQGAGAQRVMLTLAAGFAHGGCAVDLIVPRASGAYISEISELPQNVRFVNFRTSRLMTSLFPLARYLRLQKPDALIAALGGGNVIAVLARLLSRTPVRTVVTEHSAISLTESGRKRSYFGLLPSLLKWAYARADKIVAVSAGAAEDLAAFTKLPRSRISVIHNPVVTENLSILSKERPEHQWFRDGEPPVVLGVGRLVKVKDFRTLIDAFERVRRKRVVRLMILGEGPEKQELASRIRELGLDFDVEMPGFSLNPYSFMRYASVLVLSSRWEGFGNVLVEAMACDTPVVSTDCPGGPREILEGGKHGLLAPVGDAQAMATAIERQLDEPITETLTMRAEAFTVEAALKKYADATRIRLYTGRCPSDVEGLL